MKTKKFNIYSSFEKAPSVNEEKGYVEIEGWASRNYDEKGKVVTDYDSEIVQTSGFDLSRAKTLLYMHDHSQPAGTIELSHRPEGIWCNAKVYKELHPQAYVGVKVGAITGFSIGFIATEYTYTNVDGEDYATFTKGTVLENSLVTIGSNPQALITSVKGLMKDGECKGLQCSIKDLKAMNPDCGCDEINEKREEVKDIKEIIKGLTFEDTEKEVWNEGEKLSYYMRILKETISDNFYETIWSDGISGEEAKSNIIDALTAFSEKLNEFETLKNTPQPVDEGMVQKTIGEEMIIKSEEGTSTPAEEIVEQTVEGTEESQVEGVEETPEQEVENTEVTEESSESLEDKVEQTEVTSDEGLVEESAKEPVITAQSTVGYLATVDLDKLSAEEIEAVYNTASDVIEKIEAYVKADIAEGGE